MGPGVAALLVLLAAAPAGTAAPSGRRPRWSPAAHGKPAPGNLVPPAGARSRNFPPTPNTTLCRASVLATGQILIKDHGAKGNGVHDDAPALRAAIAEGWRCGGQVLIPTGNYLINSTVQLGHCAIIGVGTTPIGYGGAADVVAYDTGPAVRLFTRNASGPVLQAGYLPGSAGYATLAAGGCPGGRVGATGGCQTFGGAYLEGLSIEGLETGLIIANTCWIRLRNCGVSAELLTGTANNAAMVVYNTFWVWFEEGGSFAFRVGKGLLPSVKLMGTEVNQTVASMCTCCEC